MAIESDGENICGFNPLDLRDVTYFTQTAKFGEAEECVRVQLYLFVLFYLFVTFNLWE